MNDVMSWTVFNLMTDTAVLEQDRYKDEIREILLQLERKIEDIIERDRLLVEDSLARGVYDA